MNWTTVVVSPEYRVVRFSLRRSGYALAIYDLGKDVEFLDNGDRNGPKTDAEWKYAWLPVTANTKISLWSLGSAEVISIWDNLSNPLPRLTEPASN